MHSADLKSYLAADEDLTRLYAADQATHGHLELGAFSKLAGAAVDPRAATLSVP
jgi:hypothetical protein